MYRVRKGIDEVEWIPVELRENWNKIGKIVNGRTRQKLICKIEDPLMVCRRKSRG